MFPRFQSNTRRDRKGFKTVVGVETMEKREVMTGGAAGAVFGPQEGPFFTDTLRPISVNASILTTGMKGLQTDLETFATNDVMNLGVSPYFNSIQLSKELQLVQKTVLDAENFASVTQTAVTHSQQPGYTVAADTRDVERVDAAINRFESDLKLVYTNPVMADYTTFSSNSIDRFRLRPEVQGMQAEADAISHGTIPLIQQLDRQLYSCLANASA